MSAWGLTVAEWQAVRLSLQVALTAVVVSLPFGVALGWLLARRPFRGQSLVETLLNLPLVMPPVVTGYVLLLTFGRRGWIGRYLDEWFGLQIAFTWKGVALASAVMAFPLMVQAIRVAFSSADARLAQAARTLGAGRLDAFFTVTLPLARHGIVAGCVLAFARSLGEFGATLMISGSIPGRTRTIPLEIYNLLESPDGAAGAQRLVILSILIAAAALYASRLFERRAGRAAG